MALVYPFRAYRYNPDKVSFGNVLTQPYDKISNEMQEKYYNADPHNLIVVEKGRKYPNDSETNSVYTRAAHALLEWIQKKTIVQDPAPAFYVYTQEFTVPGTTIRRTRRGFIGAGKLEEYSAGIVFRHEQTLSGPKADRLELLRRTCTHTGQLFLLYSDPQLRVDSILAEVESSKAPVTLVTDEYGVIHRLWIISEPRQITAIQKAMGDQKLVIADGHHRYETSLNYRDECRAHAGQSNRNAPYESSMMTLINTRSEGLTVLPTHRVVSNLRNFSWETVREYLENWFDIETFAFADDAHRFEAQQRMLNRLTARGDDRAIGVYPAPQSRSGPGAFYLPTLKPGADLAKMLPAASPLQRQLDVVLLHQGILEPALGITPQAVVSEANLSYEREANAAVDAVDSGKAQIAFLLNPVDVELVMRVATAGEVMPQKSTDFYPKLLSGITMYRVE
jgi:uncharacterized protein (DUF1015 family)